MTYNQVEAEFMECVDKGVVKVNHSTDRDAYSYDCNYSCIYFDSSPKCPLRSSTNRWCKNDGKYRRQLLTKLHQLHPELFI